MDTKGNFGIYILWGNCELLNVGKIWSKREIPTKENKTVLGVLSLRL
jgi:hypothetical protein